MPRYAYRVSVLLEKKKNEILKKKRENGLHIMISTEKLLFVVKSTFVSSLKRFIVAQREIFFAHNR